MYLGIDVGGTKTLLAIFTKEGEILRESKFPTPEDYDQFKKELESNISKLGSDGLVAAGIGIPGLIDHKTGESVDAGGNLPWKHINLKNDVQKILPGARVFMHNDAKLAALSEAILRHRKYKRVMYLTISTGIGGGVITNDKIDDAFVNFEPGRMRFEFEGKNQMWEQFASGKALFKRYGERASELDDPAAWREYAGLLAVGFEELLPTVQPDLIIIGGGAGAHLEKFEEYLLDELNRFKDPLVPVPKIIKAQRPEEAVIFGCYDYIVQNL
jgi:predicted NBD/HSP70 family sugar kinase